MKKYGRYSLIKRFASGGAAEIWTGKIFGDNNFERVVAVKILHEDYQNDSPSLQSMEDEASILMNLKHPNVVDILDFAFEGDNPFIVMEFVNGTNLRIILKYLREKPLPIPIALFIATEISQGLGYAHEQLDERTGKPLSIVHRDVSPSNILLSYQGEVKLTDFGIAKTSSHVDRTQAGLIKGKVRYMSPEQASGSSLDGRSDIFSLGLVLFECLFGRPAYDGGSDIEIYNLARRGSIEIPEVEPELEGMLKKLLSKEAVDRYVTLRAFREDVSKYLSSRQLDSSRDRLAEFLKGLNLPEQETMAQVKAEAESWEAPILAKITEETGTIEPDKAAPQKSKKLINGIILIGIGVLATGILLVSWPKKQVQQAIIPTSPTPQISSESQPLLGTLKVISEPSEALIEVKFPNIIKKGKSPLSVDGITIGSTGHITTSIQGYITDQREITLDTKESTISLNLKQALKSNVIFDVEPFANITIPGIISERETPFNLDLSPGIQKVSFSHPPSGKSIVVSLKIDGSGNKFFCTGDMKIDLSDSPNIHCVKK